MTSVRIAIKQVVRIRGIEALRDTLSVKQALDISCEEAEVLREHLSAELLEGYVAAGAQASCELLTEAALIAATRMHKDGVRQRLAALAASEFALGISDALGMGWIPDRRKGLTNKEESQRRVRDFMTVFKLLPVLIAISIIELIREGDFSIHTTGHNTLMLSIDYGRLLEALCTMTYLTLCASLIYAHRRNLKETWLRIRERYNRLRPSYKIATLTSVVLCVLLAMPLFLLLLVIAPRIAVSLIALIVLMAVSAVAYGVYRLRI